MLCPVGDPPQTQAVIMARCCSGVHCSVGHRCCQCCSLSPLCHSHWHTHTHTHTHIYTYNMLLAFTVGAEYSINSNSCFEGITLSTVVPAKCIYPPHIWQQQRAEKGRRGEVVQYSLVDVAGHYAELQGVLIYYCGQWSMKSWRRAERAQIPFLFPHAAHISPTHPGPPHPRVSLSPSWPCQAPALSSLGPLAPSMWLVRLPSCRGSAVVSVGP